MSRPDYKIKVVPKANDSNRNCGSAKDVVVGVAWLNPTGSISVQLNPGTRLAWDDPLHITLFQMSADKEDR